MSIRFTSSGIIFDDGTTQNTASITSGQNSTTGDGAMYVDVSSNNLRFKRITFTSDWTGAEASFAIKTYRNSGEIIFAQPVQMPSSPPSPVGG